MISVRKVIGVILLVSIAAVVAFLYESFTFATMQAPMVVVANQKHSYLRSSTLQAKNSEEPAAVATDPRRLRYSTHFCTANVNDNSFESQLQRSCLLRNVCLYSNETIVYFRSRRIDVIKPRLEFNAVAGVAVGGQFHDERLISVNNIIQPIILNGPMPSNSDIVEYREGVSVLVDPFFDINVGHFILDFLLQAHRLLSIFFDIVVNDSTLIHWVSYNNYHRYATCEEKWRLDERCWDVQTRLTSMLTTKPLVRWRHLLQQAEKKPVCFDRLIVGSTNMSDHCNDDADHGRRLHAFGRQWCMHGRGSQVWAFRKHVLRQYGLESLDAIVEKRRLQATEPIRVVIASSTGAISVLTRDEWSLLGRELIETDFVDVDVQHVDLVKYSAREQVEIVAHADVYVGPCGGGSAFLLFLPRGSYALLPCTRPYLDMNVYNHLGYLSVDMIAWPSWNVTNWRLHLMKKTVKLVRSYFSRLLAYSKKPLSMLNEESTSDLSDLYPDKPSTTTRAAAITSTTPNPNQLLPNEESTNANDSIDKILLDLHRSCELMDKKEGEREQGVVCVGPRLFPFSFTHVRGLVHVDDVHRALFLPVPMVSILLSSSTKTHWAALNRHKREAYTTIAFVHEPFFRFASGIDEMFARMGDSKLRGSASMRMLGSIQPHKRSNETTLEAVAAYLRAWAEQPFISAHTSPMRVFLTPWPRPQLLRVVQVERIAREPDFLARNFPFLLNDTKVSVKVSKMVPSAVELVLRRLLGGDDTGNGYHLVSVSVRRRWCIAHRWDYVALHYAWPSFCTKVGVHKTSKEIGTQFLHVYGVDEVGGAMEWQPTAPRLDAYTAAVDVLRASDDEYIDATTSSKKYYIRDTIAMMGFEKAANAAAAASLGASAARYASSLETISVAEAEVASNAASSFNNDDGEQQVAMEINVAMWRALATSSSTAVFGVTVSENAVDGAVDVRWDAVDRLVHTRAEHHPWLALDLLGHEPVTRVDVYMPVDFIDEYYRMGEYFSPNRETAAFLNLTNAVLKMDFVNFRLVMRLLDERAGELAADACTAADDDERVQQALKARVHFNQRRHYYMWRAPIAHNVRFVCLHAEPKDRSQLQPLVTPLILSEVRVYAPRDMRNMSVCANHCLMGSCSIVDDVGHSACVCSDSNVVGVACDTFLHAAYAYVPSNKRYFQSSASVGTAEMRAKAMIDMYRLEHPLKDECEVRVPICNYGFQAGFASSVLKLTSFMREFWASNTTFPLIIEPLIYNTNASHCSRAVGYSDIRCVLESWSSCEFGPPPFNVHDSKCLDIMPISSPHQVMNSSKLPDAYSSEGIMFAVTMSASYLYRLNEPTRRKVYTSLDQQLHWIKGTESQSNDSVSENNNSNNNKNNSIATVQQIDFATLSAHLNDSPMFAIGLHVRGTDSCRIGSPRSYRCPELDSLVYRVQTLAAVYASPTRTIIVIVATDEEGIIDRLVRDLHPLRVVWQSWGRSEMSYQGQSIEKQLRQGNVDGWLLLQSTLVDVEILRLADAFVGAFSSNLLRLAYNLAAARLGYLPPFASIDAPYCWHWRMCCDYLEDGASSYC